MPKIAAAGGTGAASASRNVLLETQQPGLNALGTNCSASERFDLRQFSGVGIADVVIVLENELSHVCHRLGFARPKLVEGIPIGHRVSGCDLCDVFCVPPSEVAKAFTSDFDHREQLLAFGSEV